MRTKAPKPPCIPRRFTPVTDLLSEVSQALLKHYSIHDVELVAHGMMEISMLTLFENDVAEYS